MFRLLPGFLQDRRVKVSLFLQEGIQNPSGRIILPPPGNEVDGLAVGTVRMFSQSREVIKEENVSALCSTQNSAMLDFSCVFVLTGTMARCNAYVSKSIK